VLISGFNFLVPSDTAMELLREINVENKQGPTDEYFRKGMELYWGKKYSQAMEQFEVVLRLCPGHRYAQEYIIECQKELVK
jgi:outer membrane protein assembly factor BamD (BamD/ComL family)